MPTRLITVFIVLFWAGSMAWLCAVVWAPPASRMAKVDPQEVYGVFFGWNDTTTMTVLEHGVRRGQITVSGGSGEDWDTGIFSRVLSVSGSMERFDELSSSSLVELLWKGTVSFSGDMEMQDGEFSVRVPGKELSALLAVKGGVPGYQAKVTLAGSEILGFDSAGDAPLPPLLGQGLLESIPGFDSFDPASIKFESEARMGSFNFAGRDMRAFLLLLRSPEHGQELLIYLSEVGEPLKIESDLGFEAISEILVPLDAYLRKTP